MTTLVKHAIIFLLTISTSSTDQNALVDVNNLGEAYPLKNTKEQAFQVLENKCNVCHHTRNKKCVFTPKKYGYLGH
ncbi:hypothetical protein [Maribacter algicola]|uniref:hypothetical protein n=1 Tax=Maribacter algicola TaxID=2498892 RepID=UPI000F64E54A|nr:hypothetical protein [Maribacter algicola]